MDNNICFLKYIRKKHCKFNKYKLNQELGNLLEYYLDKQIK